MKPIIFTQDIRNSTMAILDDRYDAQQYYTYDIYGKAVVEGDEDFQNDCTFTGAIAEGGDIYYMNARFYDANTGRFLTQDTYKGNAWEPMSQNLYSYVGNNPVNYIDPTGHYPAPPQLIDGERFADAGDNIVPEPPTAIVFYDPDEDDGFARQARDEAKRLEEEGHTVKVIAITSDEQFAEEWNKIDDAVVEHVTMILHGGSSALSMGPDDGDNFYVSDRYSDSNNPNNTSIDELDEKSFNLDIHSCSSAHQTFKYDNIAYHFSLKVNGTVTGWDGGVSFYFDSYEPSALSAYGVVYTGETYGPRLSFDQVNYYKYAFKAGDYFAFPTGKVQYPLDE